MKRILVTLLATTAIAGAAPALADPITGAIIPHTPDGPHSVPEPADAALVALGAAGVAIGRKLQARRNRR